MEPKAFHIAFGNSMMENSANWQATAYDPQVQQSCFSCRARVCSASFVMHCLRQQYSEAPDLEFLKGHPRLTVLVVLPGRHTDFVVLLWLQMFAHYVFGICVCYGHYSLMLWLLYFLQKHQHRQQQCQQYTLVVFAWTCWILTVCDILGSRLQLYKSLRYLAFQHGTG